jgi:hypothetical protein
MRIKINKKKKQLATNRQKIRSTEASHRKLVKAFERLASDKRLSGKGYDSLRKRVSSFDLPLSKGFVSYTVSLGCLYEAQIGYINKYYLPSEAFRDSDEIHAQLMENYAQLKTAEEALAKKRGKNTKTLEERIAALEAVIDELEDRIVKMNQYDAVTRSMYDNANRFAETLKRGARYSGSLTWQNGWLAQVGSNDKTWQKDLEANVNESWWEILGLAKKFVYSDEAGLYGGDQAGPTNYFNTSKKREEGLAKILKQYKAFKNMNDAEQQNLLRQVASKGCAYTALANSIMEQYYFRPEDFKKDFGFSLFRAEGDKQVLNFEPLVVDIFCARAQYQIDNGKATEIVYEGHSIGSDKFAASYIADKTNKQEVTINLLRNASSTDLEERVKDSTVIINANAPSSYSHPGKSPTLTIEHTIDTDTKKVTSIGHATVLTDITTSEGKKTYTVSSWGGEYIVSDVGTYQYVLVDTNSGRIDRFVKKIVSAADGQKLYDVRTRFSVVTWSAP